MTPVAASPPNIAKAARLVRAGEIVVFPTDTIYGLGGDATNDAAVESVFRIKRRPADKALPVLVGDARAARRHARFDSRAERLAAAFWPGPLTLVLPLRPEGGLSSRVVAGGATVALRVPNHPVALALIEAAACPLAGPSANPSGGASALGAWDLADELGTLVALILDAGPAPLGLASTVLDLSAFPPRILRSGTIGREPIEAVIGRLGEAPAPPGTGQR